MKIKLLLTAILLLSSLETFSQAPNWLWAKGIGGTSYDYVNSLILDTSRNVYTTGGFYGTVDFDPGIGVFNLIGAVGGQSIFVSKLDSLGNFVWAKAFGGLASGGEGYSIAHDDLGNVYITGHFFGTVDFDPGVGVFNLTSAGGTADIFISKLDNSGNFVWVKTIGGIGVEGSRSMALDAAGNFYITGYFEGTTDFDPGAGTFNLTSSPGSQDIFICKLDGSCNFVWAKRIGGTDNDYCYAIALDIFGNVYTTGQFGSTVDFNPGAGVFNLTSAGGFYPDIFISKLDNAGNFVWAKTMGDTSYDYGFSLALDTSGNVYTTGRFDGTVDFDPGAGTFDLTANGGIGGIFISKLDSSGNFVWAKAMGGPNGEGGGYSIALSALGGVYTTGSFHGTVDFDPDTGTFNLTVAGGTFDLFVSKLNASGNFVWAKATGGNGDESGESMALDAFDNAYVTGFFSGPAITFDTTNLINATAASYDIFIAKLSCSTSSIINPIICDLYSYISPSGNYTWTTSGSYLDTIPNSSGCDSVITINLTVITVDTSVTQNDVILTANTFGATFQWLNCDSGFIPISGDTNQVFSPSVDGNYAVAITQNGCTDTSSCHIVTGVGITEISFGNNLSIFPNPAKSELRIESSRFELQSADVYDLFGKKIIHYSLKGENIALLDVRLLPAGIYSLVITAENNSITQKLIIQK